MHHFNTYAEIIIKTAANAKARAFAEKVVASIHERGDAWIESNALELGSVDIDPETFANIAPVQDNRLFFMSKWQLALAS